MEKNPFDLKGRKGGPPKAYQAKTWSAEEIKEKLKSYVEIPEALWKDVKAGTHVRYYTKKDGYRPGGFVMKNPFDTKPEGSAAMKRFIKFQNGFDTKKEGYSSWLVAYEDLDSLFAKSDVTIVVFNANLEGYITKLNTNVKILDAHIKSLDDRLHALEKRL
jgi:hypothetical protein